MWGRSWLQQFSWDQHGTMVGQIVHCMNLNFAFPDCFYSHVASLLQHPSTEVLDQCRFPTPAWFIYIRALQSRELYHGETQCRQKPQPNHKAYILKEFTQIANFQSAEGLNGQGQEQAYSQGQSLGHRATATYTPQLCSLVFPLITTLHVLLTC